MAIPVDTTRGPRSYPQEEEKVQITHPSFLDMPQINSSASLEFIYHQRRILITQKINKRPHREQEINLVLEIGKFVEAREVQ